jgi:putative ABC transport system permease protein
MVGLALVLFVTVFADGLRQSSRDIINKTFGGDYAIVNADGLSPIPAAAARAAAITPDVQTVSSLKASEARFGPLRGVTATGLDPSTIADVYTIDWLDGNNGTLKALGADGAIVERDTARRAHVDIGDRVPVRTPDGRRQSFRVRGIYQDAGPLAGFAIPLAAHDRLFGERRLSVVYVKLTRQANRAQAGLELGDGLKGLPGVRARSQAQLGRAVAARVDRVLALFSSLLGLSVLIALLGIAATLTLSIYERRRELGLVRALGMPRRQVRRVVRFEGLITAALGAALGVVLGLFLAWAATLALADRGIGFHMPWLALLACVVLALVAGALASVLPARRAAQVPPLEAIGLP